MPPAQNPSHEKQAAVVNTAIVGLVLISVVQRNCLFSCDAKSKCGKYAPKRLENYPLNASIMETGTDIRVKVLWYYGRILWEALSNGCEQIKDCKYTSKRSGSFLVYIPSLIQAEVHALGALQANVTLATSRVDIDWEYPVADRGGAEDGFRTYVQFSKELRAAVGNIYGITMALSDSYCEGFDDKGMAQYVDWFNFMTYDIHGTWDGSSKWTNGVFTPIQGLDLLWRNSVPPEKVSLGLAFYGRSFALADPSYTTPGCTFTRDGDGTSGGAKPVNVL
ncbi:hypothetical protein PABG_11372 [Paracoccidioides brasiliensis Pb03]|nr:hypothetical protein PABG_11372 [Paracoccidioides brasiliensis Pb03]